MKKYFIPFIINFCTFGLCIILVFKENSSRPQSGIFVPTITVFVGVFLMVFSIVYSIVSVVKTKKILYPNLLLLIGFITYMWYLKILGYTSSELLYFIRGVIFFVIPSLLVSSVTRLIIVTRDKKHKEV